MSRLERAAAGVLALLATVLVLTDAVPLLRGPAPYPPEWRWERRAAAPAPAGYAWPVTSALLLVALVGASGARWFRAHPRRGAGALLIGATLIGTSFQVGLLDLEPAGAPRTLLARVISRTDTGYYTVAVSPAGRDGAAFLDRHAELLRDLRQTAKHAATHPPGPVLYYRAWIAACDFSPLLTRVALAAAGLEAGQGPTRRAPHTPASIAGALLGGTCLLALCAAACGPIALLLRVLGQDLLSAARIGALWPLVPGAALMSPQFDQALALPVSGAIALLALATKGGAARTRLVAALGAGTLAALAAFVSYGAGAFVGLGGLAVVAALGLRPALRPLGFATSAALLFLGVTVALGHEPVAAARTALEFHHESYTAPRRYALWLAFNPIDFALFLGPPIVGVGLLRLAPPLADPPRRFRAALLAGLAVLLLSGAVRGELGRIGVPLMALALPAALGDRDLPARDGAWLAGLAAILCIVLRACWLMP